MPPLQAEKVQAESEWRAMLRWDVSRWAMRAEHARLHPAMHRRPRLRRRQPAVRMPAGQTALRRLLRRYVPRLLHRRSLRALQWETAPPRPGEHLRLRQPGQPRLRTAPPDVLRPGALHPHHRGPIAVRRWRLPLQPRIHPVIRSCERPGQMHGHANRRSELRRVRPRLPSGDGMPG